MASKLKWKRELLAFAKQYDPTATIEATGGSHLALELHGPNGSRRVVTALSPSDRRAVLNIKSDIRRAARDVGVEA